MQAQPVSRAGRRGNRRPVSAKTRASLLSVPYTNNAEATAGSSHTASPASTSPAARDARVPGEGAEVLLASGRVRACRLGGVAEMVLPADVHVDAALSQPGEFSLQLGQARVARTRQHAHLEARASARAERVF